MSQCTPIQALRKPKVLGMSIFDWVVSLLGAWLLGCYIGVKGVEQWFTFVIGWILIGVIAHKAFGVDSMLGYYLGLNAKPVRVECS